MTETNHASEAAASSPENQIRVKLEQAIDQLTGIVRRQAAGPNALDRFPPSLADVEKAKGAIRHLVDWQIDEQRGLQAELVRLRTQLVRNVLTSHADVGGAETRVVAFGWEGSDPMPTWLDIERTTPGSGMTRRLVHEAVVEKMRADRDAWKHKADTLGGDLNRIRSLVPTASDEQTTFDAVQAELQRLRQKVESLRAAEMQLTDGKKLPLDIVLGVMSGDVVAQLRSENERLRAEIEQLVWNLAGISTIACAEDLCGYEPGKEWERPALSDTVKLVRTVKTLRAEAKGVDDRVQRLAKVVQCQVGDDVYDAAEKKLGELRIERETLRGERDRWREKFEEQQALLDEIARLVPGKGTLLGRVQKAANGYIWRERLLRLRDGIKAQLAWCTLPGGAPFAGMHDAHAALSCALRNADALMAEAAGLTGDWCGTNRPEMPPLAPKVGPATGQPRTEAPLDADGSGTVLELGEAFRQNLSNAVACLPEGAIDPTTTKIAIRNLHACVAEMAKVVERIGAR